MAVTRPDIYVYNDEIVFQALAYDFSSIGAIDKGQPFRTTYPPLYAALLSFGYNLPSRFAVYGLQLFLSQAALFSAVFPLYFLSRHILTSRMALWPPLLFCFMPLTLYSRWLMSENLYLPLFITGLWLVVALGNRSVKIWHSLALAIVLSAAVLTRLQGVLLAAIVAVRILRDAWLDLRCGEPRQLLKRGLYHIIFPAALTGIICLAAWSVLGYFNPGEKETLLYWKPHPGDVISAGHLLRIPLWIWRNAVVFTAGCGLLPAVLFLTTLFHPPREHPKSGRALNITWMALVIHSGLAVYLSWWKDGVQPAQAKTYCRYAICVVPLLLPFAVAQITALQKCLEKKRLKHLIVPGVVVLVCVLASLGMQPLRESLWWFGSNLQPAALAWIMHSLELSAVRFILLCAGIPLLFLATLRWRLWAAFLFLLIWLAALQISGHLFLDWVSAERESEHQTDQLRRFSISYFDRSEQLPPVVISSTGAGVDYPAAAVRYWAGVDPVIAQRGSVPESYLYFGRQEPGDILFWNKGDFKVWLKNPEPVSNALPAAVQLPSGF